MSFPAAIPWHWIGWSIFHTGHGNINGLGSHSLLSGASRNLDEPTDNLTSKNWTSSKPPWLNHFDVEVQPFPKENPLTSYHYNGLGPGMPTHATIQLTIPGQPPVIIKLLPADRWTIHKPLRNNGFITEERQPSIQPNRHQLYSPLFIHYPGHHNIIRTMPQAGCLEQAPWRWSSHPPSGALRAGESFWLQLAFFAIVFETHHHQAFAGSKHLALVRQKNDGGITARSGVQSLGR